MKMQDKDHVTVAQDIVMFEEVLEMDLKDAKELVFSSLKTEGEADEDDITQIELKVDEVKKELEESEGDVS